MEPPQQTNLLKFLRVSRQRKNRIEKICMPEQTYGVSAESPQEFQQVHTLVNPLGYKYEHDQPANSPEAVPFSQKTFFTIDLSKEPVPQYRAQMSQALERNAGVFHRRKGLLSEYMDKNGWMARVHKLMGYERSETARACSNRDRQDRIKNTRKSPNSVEFQVTDVLQRPVDKRYVEGIPALMAEKMRIRRNRNSYSSEMQTREREKEATQALNFKIDSFAKKELSQQMSQRAQTSRSHIERLTRTSDSSAFKKTNGFRSTRESFRPVVTPDFDIREYNHEETELSEFESSKRERINQKVIPEIVFR